MQQYRILLSLVTVGAIILSSFCDAWTLGGAVLVQSSKTLWRTRDRNLASASSSALYLLFSDPQQEAEAPLLWHRRKLGAVVASTLLTTAPIHSIVVAANAAEPVPADGAAADAAVFADIAARAQRISQQVDAARPASTSSMILATNKTAYDFSLPISGTAVPFKDIIQQNFVSVATSSSSSNSIALGGDGAKIKAILVVNIKQDDPVARKDIPELMTLATRYNGAVAILACPTDQGYYEPDTSQLLKLKLASEYGYGINPNTVVTDKVNVLGSAAHPFWRWLQSTCRTPFGLGRLQGNFEKFLVDGRTGLPVRRYPRKYRPLNMVGDIEALLLNKPLPPASANYLEEWRTAATEAQTNTYRFEKGLNYFDQVQ